MSHVECSVDNRATEDGMLYCNDHQRYFSLNDEQTCGCPIEYHTADCPHLTGSYGPATKSEWLDLLTEDDLY